MDPLQLIDMLVRANERVSEAAAAALDPAMQHVRKLGGHWAEVRRPGFAFKTGHGAKVTPYAPGIEVSLTSVITTLSDDLEVPTEWDFEVFAIGAFIGLPNFASEDLSVGPINPPYEDRLLIKANNCRVSLNLKDRTGSEVFDNVEIGLDELMKAPMPVAAFGIPRWTIPGGVTIEATFTLQTAALAGQSSKYGLRLFGSLLSQPALDDKRGR